MATTYSFIIGGNNYGNPKGWEDLSIQYKYEDVTIREDFSVSVEYCESSHPGSYAFFETLATDPCGQTDLEIRRFCDGVLQGVLAYALVSTENIQVDCHKKSVTISIENNTALKRMEENQSESVCTPANTCLELYQYESGGTYLDDSGNPLTRCGAKLTDIFTEFENIFGATISNNPIFSGSYQPEIHTITVPAFAAGNLITVEIISTLGSLFTVNITAGGADTTATIAEKIAKGLICKDITPTGYLMTSLEMIHRISCTSYASNVATITTDWEVDSISFVVNGIPQPGQVVKTQSFVYSLSELVLFSPGLTDDEVCTSWNNLKSLIGGLFNGVIADTQSGISIDTYENTFSATPTLYLSDKRKTKTFDSEKLNRRGRFGSEFSIKDAGDTAATWVWVGNASGADDITAIVVGLPVALTSTGIGKLSGELCFTNTTGATVSFTYEILLNGTAVASKTINLVPLQTECFGIDDYFFSTNPEDNRFCITAGVDTFTVNPTAAGLPVGVTVDSTAGKLRVEYGVPCFGTFQGREQLNFPNTYNTFPDLSGCVSTDNRGINSDIYTGTGLAISQQIEGFHDYDDTTFAIIGDGAGAARQFERCLFFPSNDPDIPTACSCIGDQVISHYYYNMILQKPYVTRFFQSSTPSDIEIDAIELETTVDSSGNYTCAVSNIIATQVKEQSNIENYQFQHCLSPEEFDTLRTERVLLHQNCNDAQISGVIKEMECYLKPRRTNLTVEG